MINSIKSFGKVREDTVGTFFFSKEFTMLLVIDLLTRKPYWFGVSILFLVIKSISLLYLTFSNIGSKEIGQ